MAAATHFWQRHRWTALRSLLLVALLHRLHFLAFLAASSPVWLLTAFLLGAVLVHSEPNVPLAAGASEDEDRHLYKKSRNLTGGGTSGGSSASASASASEADDDEPGGNESSVTSMETMDQEDHLVAVDNKEVVVNKAAVAWTADDEHSIRSIGSLELERDARLEKLMSRRTMHRNLIDLDVHIPPRNPFDHSPYHGHGADMPGSAPSSLSLLGGWETNPFNIHIQHQHQRDREEDTAEKAAMLRRHQSFTAAGASSSPPARPSRFKPYFVAADVPGGGAAVPAACARSDNSNPSSSPSPSSSTASDHRTQQEAAVKVEEAAAAPVAASTSPPPCTNGMVVAVDVELISDSSDDDMSLQGGDGDNATGGSLNVNAPDHSDEDEEDSFEVESITRQVAAGKQQPRVTAVVEPTTLASVEENEQRERELTEHHILGAVPVMDSSGTSAGARVGAAGVAVAAAPAPPATAAAAAAGPPPVAPTKRATAAAAGQPPVAPPSQPAAGATTVSVAAVSAAAGPPPVAAPPQPAAAAAAPTPRAAAAVASAPPLGKLSSKSKVASKKIDPKKAVFGFFRK